MQPLPPLPHLAPLSYSRPLSHSQTLGALPERPATGLVVALSGGVDSVVLLHRLLATFANQPDISLRALHINHQLSEHAEAWQAFNEELCARWQVPLAVHCVEVDARQGGVEQAARQARYQIFEQELAAHELLVMGHHQQDQAETLFLRLLRGAGIEGLAAMPELRALGQGALWRPMLHESQAAIVEYAQAHQLAWVEDESNQDTRFDRNFLRQRVLPLLAERWPRYATRCQQAAEHTAEASQLLRDYAAQDLVALMPQAERLGHSITLPPMQGWRWPRQKAVFRCWWAQLGLPALTSAQLDILQHFLNAAADAQPELALPNYRLRRFKQRLYCLPYLPKVSVSDHLRLQMPAANTGADQASGEFALADGSHLKVKGLPPGQHFEVRYRCQGLRAHPQGRGHSQSLKKLFQEYRVPPWLRDHVPLLFIDEQLIAAAGYWLEQSAVQTFPELSVMWMFEKTNK